MDKDLEDVLDVLISKNYKSGTFYRARNELNAHRRLISFLFDILKRYVHSAEELKELLGDEAFNELTEIDRYNYP